MEEIIFRNFIPSDAEKMVALQTRCINYCADTSVFEAGFWFAPGFKDGKNIIIATLLSGEIIGYGAITLSYFARKLDARILWLDLRVDPAFKKCIELKDAILLKILQLGRDIKIEQNLDRTAVAATYFSTGKSSIEYLSKQGFCHFETALAMRKDLSETIPIVHQPSGIEILEWRMPSQTDQENFLTANEAAFGYQTWDLEGLKHLLKSKLWEKGTTVTAFYKGKVISSVMALSNGLLETVFTVPDWRRKGIARILVSHALQFLYENGHQQAWLEVLSHHLGAQRLYKSFGFKVCKEELSLGFLLE
jgi:GNAT superfamily N-acetyltransferase